MDRGQHGLGAVRAAWMSAALAAMMLAGCGGGNDDTAAGEAQIHVANALRIDWNTILPAARCTYSRYSSECSGKTNSQR